MARPDAGQGAVGGSDALASRPQRPLPRLPRRWMVVIAGTVVAAVVVGAALALWRGREVISCGSPTATVATDHTLPIGSPAVPVIGPIALHTDPYQPGSPTRAHVETRAAHPDAITLTGYHCRDRTALRFWYEQEEHSLLTDSDVPLGRLGTTSTMLPAGPAGEIRHGYLMFTAAGDWLIIARTPHGLVGTVLVHVRDGKASGSTVRPSPIPAPSSRPGVGTLNCSQPIGAFAAPTAPQSNILNAVGLDTTSTLQLGDLGGTGPHRLFAKTGLLVHVGHEVTLSVPAAWATRVSIAWGNHADQWVASLRTACPRPPSSQDQWLAFPGGFSVDSPACVPLEIQAGKETTTVHISLGTHCPG